MPNNATYNGWSNRETWLVNLHFGDSLYETASDPFSDRITESKAQDLVYAWLEDRGAFQDPIIDDILNAALDQVNWAELIGHLYE